MHRNSLFVPGLAVFFGAFLLFWMEPFVGRLLMPYFGGSAHVWLTCLAFFQATLLVGYLFAHFLADRAGRFYPLALILPLFVLPFEISPVSYSDAPVYRLLIELCMHAALPAVVLSTTAVVMQIWFIRSRGADSNPYVLYAASNTGSLFALLGYTFFLEPLLGLRIQSFIWLGTYLVYVVLMAASWFFLKPKKQRNFSASDESKSAPVSPVTYLRWLLLAGLPSAFLLTVTNTISLEIGSFPLSWIAPLSLYLASFIVTFRAPGGSPRLLGVLWPEVFLFAVILYLIGPADFYGIIGHLSAFFAICVVSHGTLYEMRPSPERLTRFYITIAVGGWLGGSAVSFLAPFVLRGLYEYPIILISLAVILLLTRKGTFKSFMPGTPMPVFCGRVALSVLILAIAAIGVYGIAKQDVKLRHRNFYGTYRVIDWPEKGSTRAMRKLVHGNTLHGAQMLDPALRPFPVAYYHKEGAISDVFKILPTPSSAAVVGLGAGAVAAYAKAGDKVTYYEIDADNEAIARKWFTFLNETKGEIAVIPGDGRMSLAAGSGQNYDMIFIDAFTGDAIPVHLLTKEAMAIYFSKLKDDGILLFHISNRFYDLRRVIKSTAMNFELFGAMNAVTFRSGKKDSLITRTMCIVFSKRDGRIQPLIQNGWTRLGEGDGLGKVEPWTDDYINILSPMLDMARKKYRESGKN